MGPDRTSQGCTVPCADEANTDKKDGCDTWKVALVVALTMHGMLWCGSFSAMAETTENASPTNAVVAKRDWRMPLKEAAEDVEQDAETIVTGVKAWWQGQGHVKRNNWFGSKPSPEAGPESSTWKEQENAENRALLQDVWDVVDRNYYVVGDAGSLDHEQWKRALERALQQADLNDRASTFRAAQAMLNTVSAGDRYTRFLTPAEFDRLRRYDASGIGINLCDDVEYLRRAARGDAPAVDQGPPQPAVQDGEANGYLPTGPRVLGLVPGSPAEKAGLRQGDQILAIDAVPLEEGLTPWETTERISRSGDTRRTTSVTIKRGRGGSVDTLEIQLPGKTSSQPRPTTTSYLLDATAWGKKVGVLKMTEMGANTPKEVRERVQQLLEEGVDGLLLDLRGNRGGLVPSAVEVARLFLHNDQKVVIAAGGIADPLAAQEIVQGNDLIPYSLPLAVQVDGRTASAAEILVGALRDNCRAVVVGAHRTFGKGIVQSVYALPQGAGLVLTVGAYQTPALRPIHLVGMPPDFRDLPTADAAQEILGKCSRGEGILHNG